MTLLELLSRNKYYGHIDLTEPDFILISVFKTCHYHDGRYYSNFIDILDLEALYPGEGSFKKLITNCRKLYPDVPIQISECTSLHFADGLKRLGFVQIPDSENYILLP